MPSSELQTNFGVLQIDTENSATGFQIILIVWNISLGNNQKIYVRREPISFFKTGFFFFLSQMDIFLRTFE